MPKSKPTTGSTHTCQMCGTQWVRYHNLGKPKWCSPRCAELGKFGVHGTCKKCGRDYFGLGKMFCSQDCAGVINRGVSDTGPSLWAAYAASDWDALQGLIRDASTVSPQGCWLWTGRLDRYGYPIASGGRNGSLRIHRAVVEAKHRAPLGSQSAHHVCANRTCVNPEHVVGITQAENVGEMLARRAYLARIRELEGALAEVSPAHPLLAVVPVH